MKLSLSNVRQTRYRGISWAPVLFLLSFLVAVGVIAYFFLEPLLQMANEGSPEQRKRLAAYATLAMAVLVLVLLAGIVLTLRMGRRLAGIAERKRIKTVYPDAWEESAKRLETPPAEELEEGNGEKPKN